VGTAPEAMPSCSAASRNADPHRARRRCMAVSKAEAYARHPATAATASNLAAAAPIGPAVPCPATSCPTPLATHRHTQATTLRAGGQVRSSFFRKRKKANSEPCVVTGARRRSGPRRRRRLATTALPRCRAAGGDALHRVSYFPRNAVVASRWCLVRSLGTKTPFQPRSVLVPFTLRSRSNYVLLSFCLHWSSDPVILSSFSNRLESSLWGSRASADGSLQEHTPLGWVGVSLWRPWWGRLLWSPPMTGHGRKGPLSPVVESVATWSLDLFLQGLPLETRWLPASALWEGLGRSWFVTTCVLGPWDVHLS